MAYRIIPVPDVNALVEIYEGPQRLDDLLRLKEEELARGLVRPGVRTIADLRRAHLDMTPVEAKAYAAWHVEHNPDQIGARTALVVASEDMEKRLYALYTNAVESIRTMQVFYGVAAAIGWLGLAAETVASVWPEATKEEES